MTIITKLPYLYFVIFLLGTRFLDGVSWIMALTWGLPPITAVEKLALTKNAKTDGGHTG